MAQRRKEDSPTVGMNIQLDKDVNEAIEIMAFKAHMDKKWFVVKIVEEAVAEDRKKRGLPREVNRQDLDLKEERLEANG